MGLRRGEARRGEARRFDGLGWGLLTRLLLARVAAVIIVGFATGSYKRVVVVVTLSRSLGRNFAGAAVDMTVIITGKAKPGSGLTTILAWPMPSRNESTKFYQMTFCWSTRGNL